MSDMFREFDQEFSGERAEGDKEPPVELAGSLVLNREKAILWSNGISDDWIPKSQITSQNLDSNRAGTIFVKAWFVEKEGLE